MEIMMILEDMKVIINGVLSFVTNVKVGDMIGSTYVTEVQHKHMRSGYYIINNELKITNDHPLLVNGEWRKTEDVIVGDYINNIEVTSTEFINSLVPTVSIVTQDDRYDVHCNNHTYTVHGQYKLKLKKAS
tara:strand:- start:2196 stop:2588 length:393 start_codon:yes stop_codon:yes gene_type:complete